MEHTFACNCLGNFEVGQYFCHLSLRSTGFPYIRATGSPQITLRGGQSEVVIPIIPLGLRACIMVSPGVACRLLARRYGTQGFSTTTCPIDFKCWNWILLYVLDPPAKF